MVFTVPLCAVYFGSLVLISPVSNLLCLTASSAVFMLGLLAVLASFLWLPLGAVIGFLPALLTKYILWTSGVLASLPYHAVYLTNPYLKYWLVFLYGLFAAAYFLRPRARRKYAVATVLAAMSLAVTVWLGAPHYTRSGLDAYVLDVGQGGERAAVLRRAVRPGGLRQPQQLVRRRRHRGGSFGHHGLRDPGLPDPDPLRL